MLTGLALCLLKKPDFNGAGLLEVVYLGVTVAVALVTFPLSLLFNAAT